MKINLTHRMLCVIFLITILASCNMPGFAPGLIPASLNESPENDISIATPLPPLAVTLVNFLVQIPSNTPDDEMIYLTVLDEVTGVALNSEIHPMAALQTNDLVGENKTDNYILTLPFAIGSVVKYRYERQSESLRVSEHLSDGSAVRYRHYLVQGQGTVKDVVSSWTDTEFKNKTGRIIGNVKDGASGLPIPNLLVTAGGAQSLTHSDGSFLIEGLPPGVHNMVVYSLDGAYQTFQQGALVAANSTTPASILVNASQFTKVVFVVKVPENTPPVVPVRLAGNLYQLGNTFAILMGGMSSLAANMPVMNILPDGRYTLTIKLPIGADIRYKYSLGDGFWNAEHLNNGEFNIRQIIVPEFATLIEDSVDTWHDGKPISLTFDVFVPEETPSEDFVSIQFNPLFGWTEPISMWRLDNNRWAYILFSPLNLPGNFSYRYCLNGQCGDADDILTPGQYGEGRALIINEKSQSLEDSVNAWKHLPLTPDKVKVPKDTVPERGPNFWAGIEWVDLYKPSWKNLLPTSLQKLKEIGANWLVISPTWTYGRTAPGNEPPILMTIPGQDPLWNELKETIQQARSQGLMVALYPTPHFQIKEANWWSKAPRTNSWWQIWFDQYRKFILHHADLATQSEATALIIGGDWLTPALPGGKLDDGVPSGIPEDAEQRWRDLITEIRNHYNGSLIWGLSYQDALKPPEFLDSVDQIYLQLSLPSSDGMDVKPTQEFENWIDNNLWTFQILQNKPVIFAFEYASDPDIQSQVDAYSILLKIVSERNWIGGFVSRGFYPPVALQDQSPSIHGKSTSELLSHWFPRLLK